MNKIDFKDLPDTTTPFTADIFNEMQDNVEDAIDEVQENLDNVNTYSTDEINTGKKWIDGKPIYRKIINVEFPDLTNAIVSTTHNITNIEMITDCKLVWYDTFDNRWYNNFKDTDDPNIQINGISSTDIRIKRSTQTSVNWNGRTTNKYVIIEYTKTTDEVEEEVSENE